MNTPPHTLFLERLTHIIQNNNVAQWSAIIKLKHINKDLCDWVISTTSFLPETSVMTARIYCIVNNITEIPLCHYCKKPIKFRDYTFGFNKYCGARCASNCPDHKAKRENTCLEKYGTRHYLSTKDADIKRRQTNLNKYGVENVAHMNGMLERKRAGSLKKYGETHHMKTQESKDKIKKKNLELYGNVTYLNSETMLNSNKEKTGYTHYAQNPEFHEKRKKWLDKKGVTNITQLPEIKEIIRNNNLKKYGVVSPTQKNFKNFDKWNDIDFIQKVFIKGKKVDYVKAEKYFNANEQTIRFHFKYELGLDIKNTNTSSKAEDEIHHYIEGIVSTTIIRNSRKILKYEIKNLDGTSQKKYKEVDIYIPDLNLAIEYDGLYYHSIGTVGGFFNAPHDIIRLRTSLQDKYKLFKERNIKFLNIWENEWQHPIQKEIWKSMILNALHHCNVLYARECSIVEITDYQDEYNFLEHNHMQGHCRGSFLKLGLVYEGVLVSLMTFGKHRYTNNNYIELYRFCNKRSYRVIGAASKLLKYFKKKYTQPIISYANKRWSDGKLYQSIGFTFSHETAPNYFYFKANASNKLYSRQYFQKWMLKDKLTIFDVNKTEQQNMFDNGYRVIYDAGQLVYILK